MLGSLGNAACICSADRPVAAAELLCGDRLARGQLFQQRLGERVRRSAVEPVRSKAASSRALSRST